MGRVREARRWSAGEAQGVLDQWKRSGLPMARFARQQGYGVQRLQWWKQKLGTPPSAIARFVPVEWSPILRTRSSGGDVSGWIEIALPEGICLRVSQDADPRAVAQMVVALREARC